MDAGDVERELVRGAIEAREQLTRHRRTADARALEGRELPGLVALERSAARDEQGSDA